MPTGTTSARVGRHGGTKPAGCGRLAAGLRYRFWYRSPDIGAAQLYTGSEASPTFVPGVYPAIAEVADGPMPATIHIALKAPAAGAPGPILGAGLPGVLAMLIGGLMWWRRKRTFSVMP